MNFQSSCKIITNQSIRHYSHESQVLQKGPLLLSNLKTRSLTRITAGRSSGIGPVAAGGGLPAAASDGEASRDPRTPAGANGLPHSGPRLAGHVSRRTVAMAVAWPCSTAAKEGQGGAREDQERTAEPVTVDAGLPGARRCGTTWRQRAQPVATMAVAAGVRVRRQRARKEEWRGERVIEQLRRSV